MNLLQLQNASKSFGSKLLFEGANLSINVDEHIGVIGPNGAGKTTLFKILADELELDHGELVKSRELSLGYLRQHDTWSEDESVEDFLERDSKMPLWDLRRLGHDLGLDDEKFSKPIRALSGGYRMRVKLLHLLGQEPNLMMLDEPTNYLDLETLLVLETFLQNFKGAFLLISHDREFLRRTTDHILEIESGDFVKFGGNIDDYFEQKALLRSQLEKQALSQSARKQQILDFAARFGAKATKARQVQSRLKQLGKMETIELKPLPLTAKIRIPAPIPTGRIALEVKDADLGYPERTILTKVDLRIESKDRLGVVGFNGVGKSTLLRSLAGDLPTLYGEIQPGYQVISAYYAQHVAERLDPNHSVLEALQATAHRDIRPQEILDLAGSLLFSGDHVKKKIHILSGGEKARVALGQILLKKAPLLLLDEPTNHLDFYTVEALTQALENYQGTVVLVSHDRGFVRRVATKILEVRSGRLHLYLGSYDDYVWSVQKRYESGQLEAEAPTTIVARSPKIEAPEKPVVQKEAISPRPAPNKEEVKRLELEMRNCEKTIQDIDRKIKVLESRMAEQASQLEKLQGTDVSQLAREMAASQKKIQELEAQSMEALEKKENASHQIQELKGNQ